MGNRLTAETCGLADGLPVIPKQKRQQEEKGMRHKGKQMVGCLLLMAAMLAGMTACGNKASDTESTVQEST